MFGLELVLGLGIAIVASALLAIFIAIMIGLVIALKDTIDERKGKK
jgi:hypothetical protein